MAYRAYFPVIRKVACAAALIFLSAGVALHADEKKTDNMNCNGEALSTSERQFQQQTGDVVEPRHLEIVRPFTGTGSLDVSVCNAQLRVRTRPDAKDLRISVDLGEKTDKSVVDYVHILRV